VQLWDLGVLADEYHRTPFEMQRELEQDPEQLAVQILDLRAYARTKAAIDAAVKDNRGAEIDDGNPLVQRVVETQATLLRKGGHGSA
jgi:hypothetical protein